MVSRKRILQKQWFIPHFTYLAYDWYIYKISTSQLCESFNLNLIYDGKEEEKVQVLNAFRRNMTKRNKYLPQDSISHS